jgi:HAD superfamily hydrolase (TIGR01509 family)
VIRGVFFDAGGILYDRECSSNENLRRLLATRGHEGALSPGDEATRQELHREASLGHLPVREYWVRVLAMYDVPQPDWPDILAHVERFADDITPDPDARATLAELKRRGKVIGVITDTIYPLERKMRWLERVGVADLLGVVSCSSALGATKPDVAIYRDALDRTGVRAHEAAFVGHSAEELAGAHAVGMTTIGLHSDDRAPADHRVGALSQLLGLELLAERP